MSIWDLDYLKNSQLLNKVTINEGNTPLVKINFINTEVYVKDENHNPSGSFKDRSLTYQISYYLQVHIQ